MDLISVIVPVYNVQDYLHRCVNSILRQTYKELLLLLPVTWKYHEKRMELPRRDNERLMVEVTKKELCIYDYCE